MKRNFKSLLKYLIYILITVLLTTVVFKLSKQYDQYDQYNDDAVQKKSPIANKQIYLNQISEIDWHDWEFINVEKQRTGTLTSVCYLIFPVILNTYVSH